MRRESVGKALIGLGSAMVTVGRVGERALMGFLREAAHWRPRDMAAVVAAGLVVLGVVAVLTMTLYVWLPLGLLARAAGARLAGQNVQFGFRPTPAPSWR